MPHSGHATMLDDPRLMNNVVGEFFDGVESGDLDHFDAWVSRAVAAEGGGAANDMHLSGLAAAAQDGLSFKSAASSIVLLAVGTLAGATAGHRLVPHRSVDAASSPDLGAPFAQAG